MIGQRVINNMLGHKPKADIRSRNKINKICPKCNSKDIISDVGILPHCDDCGYILNQRKAKKLDNLEFYTDPISGEDVPNDI